MMCDSELKAQAGTIARLRGLKRTEWNGEIGLVGAYCEAKSRFSFIPLQWKNPPVLIKPENLLVEDPIFLELKLGTSNDIDICHKLPLSLSRGLDWYPGDYQPIESFQIVEGVYHFSFNAFGHHFLLDIRRQNTGHIFARLIQCWAVTKHIGFTARTWSDKLKWWNETELKSFLEDMHRLRTELTSLTETELLHCVSNGESARDWALQMLDRMKVEGLTMQPGSLEQESGYVESLEKQGFPARAVIFIGISTGHPVQILDFPIQNWRTIVSISNKWFHAHSAATFLKAIEWNSIPGDWSWREFSSVESSKI